MSLTAQDLLNLRRITNIPDAQRFLAQHEIPTEQWDEYLKLVGRAVKSEVTLVVKDPLRHWTWALLHINGCSYRQIAEYYNVRHASVYEAVKQQIRTQGHVARLRDKCSLEYMSAMIEAMAQFRDQFQRLNIMDDAALLNQLAEQLGD